MASVKERRGCLKNLARILAMILATSVTVLLTCMIYFGAALLMDTTTAFERQLPLPGQHSLVIIRRPACTWDRPSIIECYQGGVDAHPEARLLYCTPNMCRVLVSFVLPAR